MPLLLIYSLSYIVFVKFDMHYTPFCLILWSSYLLLWPLKFTPLMFFFFTRVSKFDSFENFKYINACDSNRIFPLKAVLPSYLALLNSYVFLFWNKNFRKWRQLSTASIHQLNGPPVSCEFFRMLYPSRHAQLTKHWSIAIGSTNF